TCGSRRERTSPQQQRERGERRVVLSRTAQRRAEKARTSALRRNRAEKRGYEYRSNDNALSIALKEWKARPDPLDGVPQIRSIEESESPPTHPADMKQALRLVWKGLAYKTAADAVGVDRRWLRTYAVRYGIDRRNRILRQVAAEPDLV